MSRARIEADFAYIDEIRSTSQMGAEVKKLRPLEHRKDVILHALRHSRFQFWWSIFAKECRVPQKFWPAHETHWEST